jgi:hypothetical protein
MSLDVCLKLPGTEGPERWTIFIREDGAKREISLEEWNSRFPGEQPVLCHVGGDNTIYSSNITHNLGHMAGAAGIYKHLWRPDEIGIKNAGELIEPLTDGLAKLKADPKKFEKFNAPNGWGLYKHFVPFVEEYLEACKKNPEAEIEVDR